MTRQMREAKFWAQVDTSGGLFACWPWTGRVNPKGYGLTSFHDIRSAHRIAWALTHGQIPWEMQVRHSCDNPPCCNPGHLLIGTHQDNMNDRQRRGRLVVLRGDDQPLAKLSTEKVLLIRQRWALGVSQRSLAKEFGVGRTTIQNALRRQTWAHVE